MVYALTLIIIVFLCYVVNMYQESKKKRQAQEEEQLRKAKQEKRNKDINKVISFAKNSGHDISQLMKERQELFLQACRNYAAGVFTKPDEPSKVEAVNPNSFVVYYAEQMNEKRQQQYKDLLASSNNHILVGMEYRRKYKLIEKKIFEQLNTISNSDEYIKILKQYFDIDDQIFNMK